MLKCFWIQLPLVQFSSWFYHFQTIPEKYKSCNFYLLQTFCNRLRDVPTYKQVTWPITTFITMHLIYITLDFRTWCCYVRLWWWLDSLKWINNGYCWYQTTIKFTTSPNAGLECLVILLPTQSWWKSSADFYKNIDVIVKRTFVNCWFLGLKISNHFAHMIKRYYKKIIW